MAFPPRSEIHHRVPQWLLRRRRAILPQQLRETVLDDDDAAGEILDRKTFQCRAHRVRAELASLQGRTPAPKVRWFRGKDAVELALGESGIVVENVKQHRRNAVPRLFVALRVCIFYPLRNGAGCEAGGYRCTSRLVRRALRALRRPRAEPRLAALRAS